MTGVRTAGEEERTPRGQIEALGGEVQDRGALTGPEDPDVLRVLNRRILWAMRGITYECDHRNAESLVEELQLANEQFVITSMVRESREAGKKEAESVQDGGIREGGRPQATAGQIGAGRGRVRGGCGEKAQKGSRRGEVRHWWKGPPSGQC